MLSDVFDRELPRQLDELLTDVFGDTLSREGNDNHFRVVASGQFQGQITPDLLNFARRRGIDGALLITEQDHYRALYFREGQVVAARSSALFEQLGRVLLSAELIDKQDARTLSDTERGEGVAAVLRWIPTELAAWAAHRRAWDVGMALPFIAHGHFLFIEGTPDLGALPRLAIAPMTMATHGQKLHEAWKANPSGSTDGVDEPPGAPPRPAPATQPLTRVEGDPKFGDFIHLLKE